VKNDCEAYTQRLGALADGELQPGEAADVEAHLLACAECAAELESIRALGDAIRARVPRHRAPDSLRMAVAASLRAAAEASGDVHGTGGDALPAAAPPVPTAVSGDSATVIPITSRPRRRALASWMSAAAAVAVLVAGTARVAWTGGQAAALRDEQAREVLASHVRSLIGTHLMDVASTDQHTVKPWFDGHLDFAPPVNDLADQGFPLVGGRVDYLGGQPVAALVYARRKHWINVFVWPAEGGGDRAPAWQARRGYQMASWTAAGMRHWAVSDVSQGDLDHFGRLLRAREPVAGGE
jgi:anti-sigma factor RsiW